MSRGFQVPQAGSAVQHGSRVVTVVFAGWLPLPLAEADPAQPAFVSVRQAFAKLSGIAV